MGVFAYQHRLSFPFAVCKGLICSFYYYYWCVRVELAERSAIHIPTFGVQVRGLEISEL